MNDRASTTRGQVQTTQAGGEKRETMQNLSFYQKGKEVNTKLLAFSIRFLGPTTMLLLLSSIAFAGYRGP